MNDISLASDILGHAEMVRPKIPGLRVIEQFWNELDGSRIFKDPATNSYVAYYVYRFVPDRRSGKDRRRYTVSGGDRRKS